MSLSRSIREIAQRGIKVTVAEVPIGRRPSSQEPRVHEAIDREILIHLLTRLLAWFNTFAVQNYENPDVNEMNILRREICAQINMLKKYKSQEGE